MKIILKITVLLILLNVIMSSAQDTTWFDSKWEKVSSRDSAEFYRLAEKQGEKWHVRDYYLKNNQMQMKGNFLSLNPEIKDGKVEYYFETGFIKQIVTYVNDTVNGLVITYFENCQVESISHKEGDNFVGNFQVFDKKGNLVEKGYYSDNMEYGFYCYYHSDGFKMAECWVRNGKKIGKLQYFNSKGERTNYSFYPNEFILEKPNLKITFPRIEWNAVKCQYSVRHVQKFSAKPLWDSLNDGLYPQITLVYSENIKDLLSIDTLLNPDLVEVDLSKYVLIKTLTPKDSAYPLSNKNSLIRIFKNKSKLGFPKFYTADLITSKQIGLQILMEMPKDDANNEEEFYQIMRSIREL